MANTYYLLLLVAVGFHRVHGTPWNETNTKTLQPTTYHPKSYINLPPLPYINSRPRSSERHQPVPSIKAAAVSNTTNERVLISSFQTTPPITEPVSNLTIQTMPSATDGPVSTTSIQPDITTNVQTVSTTSSKPVSNTSVESVSTTSSNPVSTSSEPVPTTSGETVSTTTNKPVLNTSVETVSTTSSKPVSTSSDLVSTTSSESVSTTSIKPVSNMSVETVSTSSSKPVSSNSDPVSTTSGESVSTTIGKPLSTDSEQVSTVSGGSVSTISSRPVSTSNEPVSTTTGESITTTSRKPVLNTSGESVSTTSSKPVSTSSAPVSTTTGELVTTTSTKSVSNTSGELVSTSSTKPVSTTTSKPESTTTSKPVTTTTSKPESTTTNKLVSTTTSKPVSTTTSKPVSTTTNKPVSTTTSKPVSTTSRITVPTKSELVSTISTSSEQVSSTSDESVATSSSELASTSSESVPMTRRSVSTTSIELLSIRPIYKPATIEPDYVIDNHRVTVDITSMKILKVVYKTATDTNLVLSGLAMMTILAMFSEDAGWRTISEINLLFRVTSIRDSYEEYKRMMDEFSALPALTFKNRIFARDFIVPDAVRAVVAGYQCEIEEFPIRDLDYFAKSATEWVSEESNGRIKEAILESKLDYTFNNLLINIASFNGHFTTLLNSSETKTMDFHLANTTIVQKPTMMMIQRLRYAENRHLRTKFVELPFQESGFRMIIAIPDEVNGIRDLIDELAQSGILNDAQTLAFLPLQVLLELPKFEIEAELDFNFIFAKLGLKHIFKEPSATATSQKRSVAEKALQKAFIKVDEDGAAVAAHAAIVNGREVFPNERRHRQRWRRSTPIGLKINRPFLFTILYHNLVLFTGTYTH